MCRRNMAKWTIELIESYLSNKKFEVKLGSTTTITRRTTTGVPQGSMLGPMLFNIVANLPNLINCKISQFADDTALSA